MLGMKETFLPSWRPGRSIRGMSAILLPLLPEAPSDDVGVRDIDWEGFCAHTQATIDAGLLPAVNMDTGYANLISEPIRQRALDLASEIAHGRDFVGGVYVGDRPGESFDFDRYAKATDHVLQAGGTPIFFQSFGLTSLPDDKLIDAYRSLAARCDRCLAFELGQMFAPFGRIYSLEVYRELIQLPQLIGAKHSSLDRQLEWDRVDVRDSVRPEFMVLTGNDLAIDMVFYGSDYLLGLSTFSPELFALRDAWWAESRTDVFELNDWLQYLGFFAFRDPVPAYKHTAAMWLHLAGRIASPRTFPGSPTRPESDLEILRTLQRSLERYR